MRKMKMALSIVILATAVLVGCNNQNQKPCLPPFIHTGFSDSLAAANHNISYAEAKEMIVRFRSSRKDSITIPDYGVFNRQSMFDIINVDSIVGVAVFNGLTNNKVMKHILIGVKASGGLDTIHCKEKSLGEQDLSVFPTP